jgi:hypothetical protein
MLTQTINLLASARPNLGGQGPGSVSGGGGAALLAALGRTIVQDEATMLRMADGKAGRRTAQRRWSPGGRGGQGRSGRKPPAVRGLTAADWRRGGGEGVGGFREAGGGGESRGAEDRGRHGSGGRVG